MKALRTFLTVTGIFFLLPMPSQAESLSQGEQRSYQKFLEGLEKRMAKFDTQGKSFKQVVDEIREVSGINIVVDPAVFEKGGDTLVLNLQLNDISVKSALITVLRLHKLSADYQNEVLFISTQEDQFKNQEVMSQTYNVRSIVAERPQFFNGVIPGSLEESQLLRDRRRFAGVVPDEVEEGLLRSRRAGELSQEKMTENGKLLVEFIRQTIAARSWETDERFAIKYSEEGTMSVSHVPAVHLQILQLLKSLEK